ncbi:hypothetical protein ACFQPA_13905 [Halomarina halobia]|uniref:DUF7718 domain-containing protein n=1 Tax=Halomarina halobia TaxID=3033386 RepID=A0ABD6A9I0_9EURY|nr:hypothetical protein [Halomarina sp. PSR21]
MTEYEQEWTTERGLPPCCRLRVAMTKRRGTPVRFVVQLEYWHAGRWLEVARSDHDVDGPTYRNVEVVGLHLDLYHPEKGQVAKRTLSRPLPAKEAMGRAERYLRANAQNYVTRFERWL